jgi:hypothetical protein
VPHWCPPNAESPFASLRCYLAEGNICCYLNRHCPVLIAHTGSWARPKSSPRLRLSLLRLVFAGCCQPLLDDGPSRRYLCNPYMGAWTLTPQCFFGALTRFFPKNFGLTLDLRRSAHHTASAMQLQQSTLFRGCSHFVMFRLPCLLDPQVAPTAETQRPQGGRAVYTTQWTCGYPT